MHLKPNFITSLLSRFWKPVIARSVIYFSSILLLLSLSTMFILRDFYLKHPSSTLELYSVPIGLWPLIVVFQYNYFLIRAAHVKLWHVWLESIVVTFLSLCVLFIFAIQNVYIWESLTEQRANVSILDVVYRYINLQIFFIIHIIATVFIVGFSFLFFRLTTKHIDVNIKSHWFTPFLYTVFMAGINFIFSFTILFITQIPTFTNRILPPGKTEIAVFVEYMLMPLIACFTGYIVIAVKSSYKQQNPENYKDRNYRLNDEEIEFRYYDIPSNGD